MPYSKRLAVLTVFTLLASVDPVYAWSIKHIQGPDGATLKVLEDVWERYPSELQYVRARYESKSALLVTHNEKMWDLGLLAKANAEAFVREANAAQAPVVGLVYPSEKSGAFLAGKPLDREELVVGLDRKHTYLYSGDYHLVQFQVDDLFMTGGSLNRCFCQSFRSVLAHSKVRRIHFLLAGMYGSFPDYWFEKGAVVPMGVFERHRQGELGEVPPEFAAIPKSSDLNIQQALAGLKDEALLRFFREGFFGNSARGLPHCDGITFLEQQHRSYTVRIFRDSKFLGVVGSGPKPLDLVLEFRNP